MTTLSIQVALDAVVAAFGFENAEQAGAHVRSVAAYHYAEAELGAAVKIALCPMLVDEDSTTPSPVYQQYLFVSELVVDGAGVRFSFLQPAVDDSEGEAATAALLDFGKSLTTGAEVLAVALDPARAPVPCNRVALEMPMHSLYAYGAQRYCRNGVTGATRLVGPAFAPIIASAPPVASGDGEALTAGADAASATVLHMKPRTKR